MLPDFVVVGAMRSGSTSLYRYLADHPDVFMPATKELRFFERNYDQGIEWYRSQFDPGAHATVRGEASPQYLASQEAMERLARHVPGVKGIAVLRHPVDRAYSHYQMGVERHGEDRTWPQVVEDELAGRGDTAYLARSRYAGQLERAIDLLGADRLLTLCFEHLRDEPDREFLAVCRFLGIREEVPASVGSQVNAYFQVRSPLVRSLSKGRFVPRRARNVIAKLNQREAGYEDMGADLRARLDQELRAERARVLRAAGWTSDPWADRSGGR